MPVFAGIVLLNVPTAGASPYRDNVLYVDNDWTDDSEVPPGLTYGENAFVSIGEATGHANQENGTILVYEGIYGDFIENFPLSFGVENLKILSVGTTKDTVIRGKRGEPVININQDNITVDGFNFVGPYSLGVFLRKVENVKIINNFFNENVPADAIRISGSKNCTIENNIIDNKNFGIKLENSSYNIVDNNYMSQNSVDLHMLGSENNVIKNNVSENGGGININNSFGNIFMKNTIIAGDLGIWLLDSSCNYIGSNKIENCKLGGIGVENSDNCMILRNTISRNNNWGIYVVSSYNNLIYHNRFENNENQAYDNGFNHWDQGFPLGGNYWSDYKGKDEDGNGIGDSPFRILGGKNKDRYPLVYPSFKVPKTGFPFLMIGAVIAILAVIAALAFMKRFRS